MMRKKIITLFLLSLFVLYPFSVNTGTAETEQTEKVLKIGIVGDPENLNPILAASINAWSLINYIYEPLVRWNLTGGGDWNPSPGLADSWEIAPNGTQVTFHLNPNAKWHDGTPVTSQDVNWTIFTFTYLSWWQASSPRFDHRNITIIDDYTIAINLVVKGYENIWEFRVVEGFGFRDVYNGTPTQVNEDSFLLGLPYMPIFPMHVWDPLMWSHPVWGINGTGYDPFGYYGYLNYDGISWVVANVFGDFVEPKVGAGPWKFVSWDPGVKIVLEAWDNYHGGRPKVDKIEFIIYETVDRATQAVISGDVDFAETNSRNALLLQPDANVDIITNDFIGFDAFFINQNFNYLNKSPGFESNIRPSHLALLEQPVRKAMQQAINKTRINEISYLDTATVTDSIIHKSLSWYNDAITHFTSGSAAAIATLTADGWFKNSQNLWEKNVSGVTGDNETLEFDLHISQGSPTDFLTASIIQEDLAAAGIVVHIRQIEPTTFVSDFTACTRLAATGCWNYDLMITDYTQTGDPTYMNFYMISTSFINLNGMNIQRVDEIYEIQQFVSDDAARKVLIDELQQVVYDHSSVIPLVNFQDFEIYRKDRWKFEDTVAISGMFSLFNHEAMRYVDVAPPPTDTSDTSPGNTVTLTAGGQTITTEVPAEASGFTILVLLFSFVFAVTVINRKRRR